MSFEGPESRLSAGGALAVLAVLLLVFFPPTGGASSVHPIPPPTAVHSNDATGAGLLAEARTSLPNSAGFPGALPSKCTNVFQAQYPEVGATQRTLKAACAYAQARAGASAAGWVAATGNPPAFYLYDFVMTYDSTDHYVLLFGDPVLPSAAAPSETWIYQRGNWTQLPLSTSPTSCLSAAMADDPVDGYVVYFGGTVQADSSACPSAGQTWEFKGGVWTQIMPSTAPSSRFSASFSNDSADRYLVLFGGVSSSCLSTGNVCGDTWTFSGGHWTRLSPAKSPSNRSSAGMTDDARDGYVLLFGGEGADRSIYAMFNDTWSFTAGNWTQLAPSQAPPQPAPDGLAYDYLDGYAIYTQVCGNVTNNYRSEVTWKFAAGAWSPLNQSCTWGGNRVPPQRLGEGTTYDGADGYFFLFGGGGIYFSRPCCNSNLNDTWTYSAGNWTDRTSPGLSFLPSYAPSVAYDGSEHAVVLFGGANGSTYLNTTWEYTNRVWTLLHPASAPPARIGAALTYDAADGYLLLFGGGNESSGLGDTWEFIGGNWARLTPTTSPSPRGIGTGMVYDAADGYVLLYGGRGYPDTWTYRAGVWTNITTQTGAPPRGGYLENPLAYDSSDGYVLLFQTGVTYSPFFVNETWSFKGGTWTNLTGTLSVSPPVRYSGAMAGMGTAGGVILFGGYCVTCSGLTSFGDTWQFSNGTWTLVKTLVSPSPRYDARLVYDEGRGAGMMFGGQNFSSNVVYDDLWFWEAGAGPSPLVSSFAVAPPVVDEGVSTILTSVVEGGTGWLQYVYSGLPDGCTSQNLSSLNCTPAGGSAGTYNESLTVTDSLGNRSTATTRLVVNVHPSFASFLSVPSSVPVGHRAILRAIVTGGTGPFTYTYSNLPPGCSSQTVPLLPCVPSAAGGYTVNVSLTDAVGATAGASLMLTVTPSTAGGLSVTSFTANPPAIVLGNLTYLNVTVAAPIRGLTYAYTGLPTGCASLNESSLACVPTDGGTFHPAVTVSDPGGDRVSTQTSLTVYPNGLSPLTVWAYGATLSSVALGETTDLYVVVTGGNGSLSFSFDGLPPGCITKNLSTLPCTPTAPGSFDVGITIGDSAGHRATVHTPLTVTNATGQPASSGPPVALLVVLGAGAGAAFAGVVVYVALRRFPRVPKSSPPR